MMRTDEEFKSEVYRRSNIRIMKRNIRRKKLIKTVSLSAAVVCCMLAVWIVSPMLSINDTPESQDEGVQPENMEQIKGNKGNAIYPENDGQMNQIADSESTKLQNSMIVVQVESEDGVKVDKQITDEKSIKIFSDIIAELEIDEDGHLEEDFYTEETDEANDNKNIILILKEACGTETKYVWRENTLSIQGTGQRYELTDVQLEKLKELIEY